MAETKPAANGKPLLRLRSHFSLLLVLWHHPVRIAVSLAIPFMLLPELRGFIHAEWQLGDQDAQLAGLLGILTVVFVPQLLASALNCQKVVYRFYADHVEFTESFLMRDVIRMPYTSIMGVTAEAGLMQRFTGVADVVLILHGRMGGRQGPTQLRQIVRDVRNAPFAVREIEKILKAWQQRSPQPPRAPVKE